MLMHIETFKEKAPWRFPPASVSGLWPSSKLWTQPWTRKSNLIVWRFEEIGEKNLVKVEAMRQFWETAKVRPCTFHPAWQSIHHLLYLAAKKIVYIRNALLNQFKPKMWWLSVFDKPPCDKCLHYSAGCSLYRSQRATEFYVDH